MTCISFCYFHVENLKKNNNNNDRAPLRVQCHAHACIFGWFLGDCISETTADIPRNQRPMLQDWRRLYTLQTMSAESARRKRDGRG